MITWGPSQGEEGKEGKEGKVVCCLQSGTG